MVDDGSGPESDSDLRRRAVWLLVMLAVVAVLLVVVISAIVGTDNGGSDQGSGPGPLDSQISSSSAHPPTTRHHRQQSSTPRTSESSSHPTATVATGSTKCPTSATCVLDGDVGDGVQAINDYRTQHGQPAVPGQVSEQAQTCALHNGNGCSGGWAETELAEPNGRQAVQKILPFAHLLDPQMKSIEVGWAYDPRAKLYYFAIVRND